MTGGAGFIGSNLSAFLLERGDDVVVVDNFSTGYSEFLEKLPSGTVSGVFEVVKCDLFLEPDRFIRHRALRRVEPPERTEPDRFIRLVDGADAVVHLAANADVRFGLNQPRRDLEQNVIVTQHVLDAVRRAEVPELVVSSTGSVYGEATVRALTWP